MPDNPRPPHDRAKSCGWQGPVATNIQRTNTSALLADDGIDMPFMEVITWAKIIAKSSGTWPDVQLSSYDSNLRKFKISWNGEGKVLWR